MTKKTKKVILSAAVLAALLVTGLCLSLLSGDGGSCYYTQVDNSRLQRVHSNGGVIDLTGGLDYSYTLPAYGGDGAAGAHLRHVPGAAGGRVPAPDSEAAAGGDRLGRGAVQRAPRGGTAPL